ncbi:MAG TPA: Ni/Fe hydrogenase subunit alpha [Candidatus Aquicultor sp.]|jgi:NAD-reducing hydrogenase large subunit
MAKKAESARKNIEIAPITRIEGHAKITVHLNDDGQVEDARLHLTQFRGFEKFCDGRPFYEMPFIVQRICGICPVSHAIASSKACDQILSVRVPNAGMRLRKLANLAQVIQSHALSLFYLSSPDILLGMDADPAKRNLYGVLEANRQLAYDGVYLRKFGQSVIAHLASTGKRVHPGWIVPGGVATPLSAEAREQMQAMIPGALAAAQRSLIWFKQAMENFREEIRAFACFPSLFMGIVGPDGELEYSDGLVRIVDSSGATIADELDPSSYQDFIREIAVPWTYMKFPSYKHLPPPENSLRVGPLARLNIIGKVDMPHAAQEWAEFRTLERGVVLSSFYYHYARLIEVLYSIEKIEAMLKDPEILGRRARAKAEPNCSEGIGVAEAPRGMLIHHYKINDDGLITWANLVIATGFNNYAMNRGVLQVAKHYITGPEIPEGVLNRLEAVVRAFDPCLSCASHAVGQMAMRVQLVGPDGAVLDEVIRG